MGEIRLSDIIGVVLKRKWFIGIFTSVCILIGIVVSYFVLEPVYVANTTFTVSPFDFKSGIKLDSTIILNGDMKSSDIIKHLDNKVLGSILAQIKYPKYEINDIINLISSKEYITKLLADTGVDIKEYDYKKNINYGYDDKKNIISLSVKHNNAEMAEKIKNSLVHNVSKVVQEESVEQFKAITNMVNKGIDRESKNLSEWKEKLDTFTKSVGGEESLDNLPASKQAEYEKVNSSYQLAQGALEAYLLVKKEVDSKENVSIEKLLNMQIITDDELPLMPVSPKKPLNVSVAAILGLVISTMAAVVTEYWGKEKSINV